MKRIKLMEEMESPEKDTGAALNLFENKILTNPLLTDAIFPQLSDSDLLTCSLVSKACNLICRGLLVDRSPSYMTLSNKTTIEDLQDFHYLISNALPGHQHPFNGIRVKFNTKIHTWPFSNPPFSNALSKIMPNLVVKFQSFDMKDLHLKPSEFQKIFQTLTIPHLKTLEFLEILNFNSIGNMKSLANQLKVGSMLKLKYLDLGSSQPRLKSSTFKRILRACPNLKSFPGFVVPFQVQTLERTNRLQLASNVTFNFSSLTPQEGTVLLDYGELIKSLSVKQRSVWGENWNDAKSVVVSKLLPLFAKHSQHHLKTLDIWIEALVAILGAQFPSLWNLKTLICRGSQRWFTFLFQASYFAPFLPNLQSVILYWTDDNSRSLRRIFSQGQPPLFLQRSPSVMDSVKELKLYDLYPLREIDSHDLLMKRMDLERIFPWVTHLEIRIMHFMLEDLLQWICECWGDLLETLILGQTICSRLEYDKSSSTDSSDLIAEDWQGVRHENRHPLPVGVKYSDKLSQLRRLELGYHHPIKGRHERFYEQETKTLECEFEPRVGQHKVQVLVSGCRAQKRMSKIKSGVSIYDTILELHPCPQDLELSLMEQIIAVEPICKKICKLLPTSDLYKCLLVSRKLNNISSEVLHQDRVCTLIINPLTAGSQYTACKLAWLRKDAPKLFSSLKLVAPDPNIRDRNYQLNKLTEYLKRTEIGHKEDFKCLVVAGLLLQPFDTEYSKNKCPDSEEFQEETELNALIKNIVKIFLGKLSLDQVQYLYTGLHSFDNLFRDEEGSLLVPNLKYIKFIKSPIIINDWKVWGPLLRDLKSLEWQLEQSFSYELLGHIASLGKAHCVARVHLRGPEPIRGEDPEESSESGFRAKQLQTPLDLNYIRQFAQNRTKLQFLFVAHDTFSSAQAKTIHREALRLLCTSSYDTLHTLVLDILGLNLLSLVYTKPLVNLNFLRIMYSHGDFDSQQLLSKIRLCKMFPTLTRVAFTQNASKVNYFLEDGERYRPQDEPQNPQPCVTVHSMEFCGLWGESEVNKNVGLSSSIILSLARLFPNVVELGLKAQPCRSTIKESQDFLSISSAFSEGWPCLKKLIIHKNTCWRPSLLKLSSCVLGVKRFQGAV